MWKNRVNTQKLNIYLYSQKISQHKQQFLQLQSRKNKYGSHSNSYNLIINFTLNLDMAFLTSLNTILKPPVLCRGQLIFFLKISSKEQYFIGQGIKKYISSCLLTTKRDAKKSKAKRKKQTRAFVMSKTILKCNRQKLF